MPFEGQEHHATAVQQDAGPPVAEARRTQNMDLHIVTCQRSALGPPSPPTFSIDDLNTLDGTNALTSTPPSSHFLLIPNSQLLTMSFCAGCIDLKEVRMRWPCWLASCNDADPPLSLAASRNSSGLYQGDCWCHHLRCRGHQGRHHCHGARHLRPRCECRLLMRSLCGSSHPAHSRALTPRRSPTPRS